MLIVWHWQGYIILLSSKSFSFLQIRQIGFFEAALIIFRILSSPELSFRIQGLLDFNADSRTISDKIIESGPLFSHLLSQFLHFFFR